MDRTALILIFFTAIVAALGLFTAMRPEFTAARGGKIIAFVTLCILPVLSVWAGFNAQIERSTSTQFCLSCHVMSDFGKSLYVDDKSYVPAAHFQNNSVPRDHACFTCHTDYTMFGDYKAKWRGVHHVMVQYLGTIPKPADIKLYTPYNNRECLHCHDGARKYEEASSHHKTPDMLALAAANQLSCMASNCHDIVHEVKDIGEAPAWQPQAGSK
jgi:cytochrome c-type protein NapC